MAETITTTDTTPYALEVHREEWRTFCGLFGVATDADAVGLARIKHARMLSLGEVTGATPWRVTHRSERASVRVVHTDR
ncbi:hypothetical protein SEA_REYNAULD_101 [Rhodococcus phage Reynauld]|uniref:Uncharacterized protein n=1 Tax=Rhodococcus phage Reynauld TaxID=3062845 RepID=A0ACD4UHP1_9CAUD|nr:hypothetical protein SEA_REYNAULD_101 [Rhodococcus phage Reynauld]